MMCGYIKLLLLDYAQGKLPIDVRADLELAIEQAINAHVLSITDVHILDLYLQGYTLIELGHKEQERLERIFSIISIYSGYTDDSFLNKCEQELTTLYRYNKARDYLLEYGKDYTTHE